LAGCAKTAGAKIAPKVAINICKFPVKSSVKTTIPEKFNSEAVHAFLSLLHMPYLPKQ
jgi:hypothetical protein